MIAGIPANDRSYISGAESPGVTLQGTLMNHSSTVASVAKQLNESRLLAGLSDSLEPNLPFIMGETNSLYNQGRPGLSNTFGAALWGVDFNLWCATNNIRRVHMHMGTNYRYQSWQPIDTNKVSKGTKAPYYGNIAVAAFLGDITKSAPRIVNLPLGSEEEAAYAAYVDNKLARIIVINMMVSLSLYTDKPSNSHLLHSHTIRQTTTANTSTTTHVPPNTTPSSCHHTSKATSAYSASSPTEATPSPV